MATPLDQFSAPVRTWFLQNLGEPTPPQSQGWLPIQRGEHTLILAPTGSGKTLAAFLWGIDQLFRELRPPERPAGDLASEPISEPAPGVRLLYISPLKALNNDVERNLRVPLAGIRTAAARLGEPLPELRVAVRTGDTPSHTRAAMLKRPPHILITTPESLYLILTSPRAREMFRTVHTVIVDEIHTLCGNKRGVHLALSLERLHHLADGHVQRIGLSATITPLDEVARFLGGQEASPMPSAAKPAPVPASPGVDQPAGDSNRTGATPLAPRDVTVVNATYHKALDLRIVSVVDDFKNLPGQSIWPFVIPRVLQDIREHHSTLVFANNRRLAERTADRLNAQLAAEQSEEIEPGSALALAPGGVMRDRGIFAIGAAGPIRAHHGSVSKESRREMEEDLKAGKLPALIGTSSLELGIDIGSVDLVVQLQSPKSVSQGLQRVGRAGHIVGETSVGRIYPTFREDLVEAAAIVHGMLAGDVEPTYTPRNPLDVLAQQIVAMVAVEEWPVPALYDLIRQTYAYRDLSRAVLNGVLGMLSGQYPNVRARVAWDRINDRLAPLPGSRLLAITNPGTIADTGAYQVYLDDHKTKVGELDEEFVFETHVGDTFLLGSQVWRVLNIENDRIVVGDAAGATPRMPFWKGDYPWRPYELGARIGRFRREIAELISRNEMDAALQILQIEYALDAKSAHHLVDHIQSQIDAIGVMASDRTIVLESFEDAIGEPRLVIHSPFGGRINGAWALALGSALRDKTGLQPETETNDDGILFHFPQGRGITPVDLVRSMTAEQAHARILRELPGSALFGAHFRMNAGRALLLPRARAQKRTPLWLQRLKARDLLAQVSQLADFPIVAETIRECLCDVLDLPHLEEILTRITRGEIQLVSIETAIPSPVASALLFQFINVYMYEGDAPKAEQQLQALSVSRELLDDLLQGNQLHRLLKPEAIDAVTARRQHVAFGYQARAIEELAVILAELGDLTTEEIAARSTGDGRAWVTQLAEQGRVTELAIPTRHGPENRWVPVELAPQYASLQAGTDAPAAVLARYLRTSGPVTRETLLDRYAFTEPWLDGELTRLNAAREIGRGHLTPGTAADEFVNRGNLEQIHRQTLSLLRKEIQPVSLPAYAAFLVRWQHATAAERLSGEQGLRQVLQQLQGIALPATVWERDVLPARMKQDAAPLAAHDVGRDLDEFCASGEIIWVAQAGRLRLFPSGRGALYLPPDTAPRETPPVKVTRPDNSDAAGTASAALGAQALAVLEYLRSEGASFTRDLEAGVSLRGDALRQALSELVTAGLVTNDSLEAYRDVTEGERRSVPAPLSALSDDLAARMQNPRALTPSRYRDAKRRVARRLGAENHPVTRAGRWSLVYRARVLGPALSAEEKSDLLARMLLTRYGILTRESLEHEQDIVEWARLYPPLERMEMRGQIRRGYFVAGLPGVQFALPEAVEALRAPAPPDEPAVVLSAVDPANLYGPERPGVPMRFARLVSTWVVQSHGRPVLVAEDGGARLTSDPEADPAALGRAVDAFLERPNAPRHVTVTQWNGDAVVNGAFETLLRDHGFRRTPGGMER